MSVSQSEVDYVLENVNSAERDLLFAKSSHARAAERVRAAEHAIFVGSAIPSSSDLMTAEAAAHALTRAIARLFNAIEGYHRATAARCELLGELVE